MRELLRVIRPIDDLAGGGTRRTEASCPLSAESRFFRSRAAATLAARTAIERAGRSTG
jgi:hypothetical protein